MGEEGPTIVIKKTINAPEGVDVNLDEDLEDESELSKDDPHRALGLVVLDDLMKESGGRSKESIGSASLYNASLSTNNDIPTEFLASSGEGAKAKEKKKEKSKKNEDKIEETSKTEKKQKSKKKKSKKESEGKDREEKKKSKKGKKEKKESVNMIEI